MRLIAVKLLLALAALAAEHVVLVNGAVLRADRHEVEGATVRLYVNGGTIEFPAALVAGFEAAAVEPVTRGTGLQPVGCSTGLPCGTGLKPVGPPPQLPGPQELVRRAAERWGLPPEFVASVAAAESSYRTDATSPKGAIGLMQLMPATAELLGANPNDAAENADAGARYLRELLLRYGYSAPLAVAAYNAGPGAVDRHGDIPPYRETRQYVQRVLQQFQQNRK